ncbi:MAG: hypothetical protein AAF645_19080 [Myxococcota bacterium]
MKVRTHPDAETRWFEAGHGRWVSALALLSASCAAVTPRASAPTPAAGEAVDAHPVSPPAPRVLVLDLPDADDGIEAVDALAFAGLPALAQGERGRFAYLAEVPGDSWGIRVLLSDSQGLGLERSFALVRDEDVERFEAERDQCGLPEGDSYEEEERCEREAKERAMAALRSRIDAVNDALAEWTWRPLVDEEDRSALFRPSTSGVCEHEPTVFVEVETDEGRLVATFDCEGESEAHEPSVGSAVFYWSPDEALWYVALDYPGSELGRRIEVLLPETASTSP